MIKECYEEEKLRKKLFTNPNIDEMKFPLENCVEAFDEVEQSENDYVRVKIDLCTMNQILITASKGNFANICRFELEKKSTPSVLNLVIINDKTDETLKELVSITFGIDHCTLISKHDGSKYEFPYHLHMDNFWRDLVVQAVKIA